MQFGDPLVSLAPDAKQIAVYLATLPNGRLMVWKDRLCQVQASALIPWVCRVCHASCVWWSLTDKPTCARCTPMPPDMLQRAWHEAQAFVAYLADGKDLATKTLIYAELDRAILSGDLNELLRLCIAQHSMWEQIRMERATQERKER